MKKTLALLLAAFIPALHAAPAAPLGVSIDSPWVKTTVPGGTVSAAYMQLRSETPVKLVKVESPVAGLVEIHDMKMNAGVMEMKAVDAVAVPGGVPVTLKPGGLHVMLMKVAKPIHAGDKVPLTLTFEGAQSKPVVLKVDAIARDAR